MDEPSKQMRAEAAQAGFYRSPKVWGGQQDFPRLQILTVAELLGGRRIDYPAHTQTNVTFKKAPKAKGKRLKETELFEAPTEEEEE
jgi:hypothetical protein